MTALVPIGEVKDAVLKSLAPPLAEILGQEAETAGTLLLPAKNAVGCGKRGSCRTDVADSSS